MIPISFAWPLHLVKFCWSQPIVVYLASLSILTLVSACSSSKPTVQLEKPPIGVVTTTVLLADLVKNIGDNLVEVTALVPPGADVHSSHISPDDNLPVSKDSLIILFGGCLFIFLE